MLDVPPPPPAIACVIPEQVQSTEIVLRGTLPKLSKLLGELRQQGEHLDIATSLMTADDPDPTAIVRLGGSARYREVGGIIYLAQLNGIAVAMVMRPPVCSEEPK